ncbi:MAG: alpha/beta fold hydrolase [Promethearchaeota archaeon]|jgi:pimeloyl-ACP methyl ester carboxylesterase
MSKSKDSKIKEKYNVETGFFEGRVPYASLGDKPRIIVNIEALSFTNEPPSGFALKRFVKSARLFSEDYTFYLIGRKQNVPADYTFTDMSNDYAKMIRREFQGPVIVIGASTGGQIAHYIAADHPDVVRKLIIISAAYRVSERGAEIEKKSAEYFEQGRYGKSLAAILDLLFTSRITRGIAKFFTRLLGKFFIGKIEYPNDFLTEVRGDIEMNFKKRLGEIKAPTLILSGALDIDYPAELVRETAEGIPNAKLILYEGYGHGLAGKWDLLKDDILEFLKSEV